LLSGSKNSHIVTLVERRSRFVMLVKVNGKDSDSVVGALSHHVQNLPNGLMTSLTWDRGTELAYHRKFTIATDVSVYFCDPQSPLSAFASQKPAGQRIDLRLSVSACLHSNSPRSSCRENSTFAAP
jgi:hypothetical protein